MKFVSLRVKLGTTFATFLLVVGIGVVAMLVMQLDSVERAALLEAEHFANVIALSTSEDFGFLTLSCQRSPRSANETTRFPATTKWSSVRMSTNANACFSA